MNYWSGGRKERRSRKCLNVLCVHPTLSWRLISSSFHESRERGGTYTHDSSLYSSPMGLLFTNQGIEGGRWREQTLQVNGFFPPLSLLSRNVLYDCQLMTMSRIEVLAAIEMKEERVFNCQLLCSSSPWNDRMCPSLSSSFVFRFSSCSVLHFSSFPQFDPFSISSD